MRAVVGATVIALLVASLAGGAPPSPTLLVLQPADIPSYMTTGTAPQLTTSDGEASVSSTKYGRQSGALSSYNNVGGISANVGLTFLTSRAVIFRDATGAHGAFLEMSDKLARSVGTRGQALDLGQEGRTYGVLGNPSFQIVWRQGNVLGYINGTGTRGTSGYSIDFARVQQNRIAALVPPAEPGPPIVVRPVIGKPAAQPAQPKAGRVFRVTFRITWSSDGTPVTSGSVASSTRVAGKAVPHSYSFKAGAVKVALGVPRTAKGKQLKITVKVTAENQAATKVVRYKVR